MIRRTLSVILHDPFGHLDPAVRRLVRRVFWSVAGVMILALSLSALFATAINLAPSYRQKLEGFASRVIERPLHIGDLALGWHSWLPSLDLSQVEILSPDEKKIQLQVDVLRLGFSPARLLLGDFTPSRIELGGLELSAQADSEGQWSVSGLEALLADSGVSDPQASLRQLARFDAIALERCRLHLVDARLGATVWNFDVERVELSKGFRGPRLELSLALPEALGDHLNLRARMRGKLEEPQNWNGDWSAEIENVRTLPWLRLFKPEWADLRTEKGQLRANGEIQDGNPVWTDLNLDAVRVSAGRRAPKAVLEDLLLRARIAPQPFGWRAEIQSLQMKGARGVWPPVRGEVAYIPAAAGNGAEWAGRLNFVRLEDLAPWLGLTRADIPAAVQGLSGDVRNLDITFRAGLGDAEPRYSLRAALDQLGLVPLESSAGFSGLSGEIALDENGGHLRLRDLALTLRVPQVIAAPVPFESLSTDLGWKRTADGWEVSAPQFNWTLAGSTGRGQLALRLPAGASPVVSLKAQFSAQDAARLKPFMPSHWGAGLHDWLTRGLLYVPITKAQLVLEGPLADFPYVQKPGQWALDASVDKADVFYAAGWPLLKGLNAELAFRGNGLTITATQGTVAGIPLQKVEARFKDFDDDHLRISGQMSSDLQRFYSVLGGSPLRDKFEGLLQHTQAQGPARLGLSLDIPLEHTDGTVAAGTVAIDGATLMLTDIEEPVRDLRGEVSFGADGISARKLEGQLLDQPLTGSITARKSGSALAAFWALDLNADSPASKKLPEGLRGRISGSTAVRAQLRLSGPDQTALVLDSDLRGLVMRLPAPLAKAAPTAAPLRVVIADDPQSGARLSADWSGRLGADLRWRQTNGRSALDAVSLRLGKDAPVFAEVLPGLSVGAVTSDLSIDDWSEFLDDFGDARSRIETLTLNRANLRANRWLWNGFVLPPTQVRAEPKDAGWQVRLDGAGAEGDVFWSRERIKAQLTSLSLSHNPTPSESRPSKVIQEPARWPEVDAQIGQLDIGEAAMGAVQLQTQRVPGGQKLVRLKTQGAENEIDATGQWLRREGRSNANLNVKLTSSDFEGLQRAFGFGATLAAKASRIDAQLIWAPSVPGLAWQQARGGLVLEFDNGFLRGVEPGVGRVLGLFNFYALPRRLTLNFSDLADKGLAFDTVRGSFAIAEGQARTEDVEVKGPSLHIKMRGRVGLAARDYDQHVTVYPGLSTGFTLGAAALAGPIGAGLVFLAQQILDQPLEKLTQIKYRVTGSWDDPQVSADSE